jgi:hypothetical protein
VATSSIQIITDSLGTQVLEANVFAYLDAALPPNGDTKRAGCPAGPLSLRAPHLYERKLYEYFTIS